MSDYLVTGSQLTNIASAIRSKNGESSLYTVDEMPSKILAIAGGGGVVPTGTYSISSNGVYNIYNYASVDVSVPGIIPSGTAILPATAGTYDVYSYSQAQILSSAVAKYVLKKDNLLTTYTSDDTTIEQGAFGATIALTSVSFSQATSIHQYAFIRCMSLVSTYFPLVKGTIGSSAFAFCFKMSSASFSLVTSVGANAFEYCSALTSLSFPELTYAAAYAFRGCQYLTALSLPKVTTVSTQAFSGCSRIKTVDLPKCTTIGVGGFSLCRSVTSYSLPLVKSVYSNAFYSNYSISSLTLPSCTMLSAYAFRYCSSLMNLYLPGSSIPVLTATAFANMPFSVSVGGVYGSIHVPSSMLASYKASTNWATYSNRIVAI